MLHNQVHTTSLTLSSMAFYILSTPAKKFLFSWTHKTVSCVKACVFAVCLSGIAFLQCLHGSISHLQIFTQRTTFQEGLSWPPCLKIATLPHWLTVHINFVSITTYITVCTCAQLCPALCNPVDCSPPGCSVHGIFQARVLEWVAISYSRGIFPTQGLNCVCWVSCIVRWILYCWATGIV